MEVRSYIPVGLFVKSEFTLPRNLSRHISRVYLMNTGAKEARIGLSSCYLCAYRLFCVD